MKSTQQQGFIGHTCLSLFMNEGEPLAKLEAKQQSRERKSELTKIPRNNAQE